MSPLIYDGLVGLCEELDYTVQDIENIGTVVFKNGVKLRDAPFTDEEFQNFVIQLERLSQDPLLKMFHFYWQDGRITTALGKCVCDAADEAGIETVSIKKLAFYSEGLSHVATFMPKTKHWLHKSVVHTY